MTDRPLRMLEGLPPWARRGLMILVPLALLGAVVAGFALAPLPVGTQVKQAPPTGLLPPSPTTAARLPALAAPPPETGQSQGTPSVGHGQHHRGSPGTRRPPVRGPVSEWQPAPAPGSAVAMMLAVARRFAVAYMPYQVGRLPGWARTAFARTCTPTFARYLLAQPARPTALQAAHPEAVETYRVAGVELAGMPDTIVVSYVSEQDSADTGALLLRLVREHGRWLVASLEA